LDIDDETSWLDGPVESVGLEVTGDELWATFDVTFRCKLKLDSACHNPLEQLMFMAGPEE